MKPVTKEFGFMYTKAKVWVEDDSPDDLLKGIDENQHHKIYNYTVEIKLKCAKGEVLILTPMQQLVYVRLSMGEYHIRDTIGEWLDKRFGKDAWGYENSYFFPKLYFKNRYDVLQFYHYLHRHTKDFLRAKYL